MISSAIAIARLSGGLLGSFIDTVSPEKEEKEGILDKILDGGGQVVDDMLDNRYERQNELDRYTQQLDLEKQEQQHIQEMFNLMKSDERKKLYVGIGILIAGAIGVYAYLKTKAKKL